MQLQHERHLRQVVSPALVRFLGKVSSWKLTRRRTCSELSQYSMLVPYFAPHPFIHCHTSHLLNLVWSCRFESSSNLAHLARAGRCRRRSSAASTTTAVARHPTRIRCLIQSLMWCITRQHHTRSHLPILPPMLPPMLPRMRHRRALSRAWNHCAGL